MANIYLLKLFEPAGDEYIKMLDLVGQERKNKILSIKNNKNRLQTLFADVLLRAVLCTSFGFNNRNLVFEKDSNGKPYLNERQVHFNISHSENMVAVAVSDRDIGIDLEKARQVNPKLTERYFSEKENEYISVNNENWQTRFFEVWTKKEAILKRSGLGLRVELNKLETFEYEFVKTYNVDEFVLSVCCENQNVSIINNEQSYSIICKFINDYNNV